MKNLLLLAALSTFAVSAPAQIVVVDATGPDTFATADMHGIEHHSGIDVASVSIDLSATAGAFWDMDGVTNFGSAADPVIGATNYPGVVTWTHGAAYPADPLVTANFNPPLRCGEFIRFGADTDFFVSDPCPGDNFATGGAIVTVTNVAGGVTTCTYAVTGVDASEAECGGCTMDLTVSGACPGMITIDVSGATPFGMVAFVRSFSGRGFFVVPAGNPCAGTELCLNPMGIGVGAIVMADAAGDASVTAMVPAALCGTAVQALDLTTCCVSNVGDV